MLSMGPTTKSRKTTQYASRPAGPSRLPWGTLVGKRFGTSARSDLLNPETGADLMTLLTSRVLMVLLAIAASPPGLAFAAGGGAGAGASGAAGSSGAAASGNAGAGVGASGTGSAAIGGGAPGADKSQGNGAAGTGDPGRNAAGTTVPSNNPSSAMKNRPTAGGAIGETAVPAAGGPAPAPPPVTGPVKGTVDQPPPSTVGRVEPAADRVSAKPVTPRPCGTAAHETDGTTTCIGIPRKR
jgi:hypothetical protein